MSLTGMTKLLSPIQLAGLTPETSASNNMSMCAQDTVPEGRATQALHGATYTPRTLASAAGGANVSTCNAPMGIADHLHGMQDNSVAEGRNAGWRESLLTPAYTYPPLPAVHAIALQTVGLIFTAYFLMFSLSGHRRACYNGAFPTSPQNMGEERPSTSAVTTEDARHLHPSACDSSQAFPLDNDVRIR